MEIFGRERCQVCEGTQVINNPFWTHFNEQKTLYQQTNHHLDDWELLAVTTSWLHQQGYAGWDDPTLPPETLPCTNCVEGYVSRWMPVTTAQLGL